MGRRGTRYLSVFGKVFVGKVVGKSPDKPNSCFLPGGARAGCVSKVTKRASMAPLRRPEVYGRTFRGSMHLTGSRTSPSCLASTWLAHTWPSFPTGSRRKQQPLHFSSISTPVLSLFRVESRVTPCNVRVDQPPKTSYCVCKKNQLCSRDPTRHHNRLTTGVTRTVTASHPSPPKVVSCSISRTAPPVARSFSFSSVPPPPYRARRRRPERSLNHLLLCRSTAGKFHNYAAPVAPFPLTP